MDLRCTLTRCVRRRERYVDGGVGRNERYGLNAELAWLADAVRALPRSPAACRRRYGGRARACGLEDLQRPCWPVRLGARRSVDGCGEADDVHGEHVTLPR